MIFTLSLLIGCKSEEKKTNKKENSTEAYDKIADKEGHDEHKEHEDKLTLTKQQIAVLGIQIGPVSQRNMNGYIQVNGKIGVPPQNEAVITTTLGANIVSISIIEGEEVKKGQILAYISHPDIIKIQTEYLETYNQLSFLEQDYLRQKKLYNANVGSGRDFQKAKATYSSSKGLVKGYESQLRLLGLKPLTIRTGQIFSKAPLKSTINGFVENVTVKTGQYVLPQKALFEIVNTDHIHADLMVFEKDISKVKNGQKVKFLIKSMGNDELEGKIFSVGKSIEEGPKALHVHAEIYGHFENLIVGMYVNARIIVNEKPEQALPEEAFFRDGDRLFVFSAEKKNDDEFEFKPLEVIEKDRAEGYVSFLFKEKQDKSMILARSGAYYLMSELKKSEAEHSH